jgi:hypothetical protein
MFAAGNRSPCLSTADERHRSVTPVQERPRAHLDPVVDTPANSRPRSTVLWRLDESLAPLCVRPRSRFAGLAYTD